MSNPFDQFDAPSGAGNPFDQFDTLANTVAGPQKGRYGLPAISPKQPQPSVGTGMDAALGATSGFRDSALGMLDQAASFAGLPKGAIGLAGNLAQKIMAPVARAAHAPERLIDVASAPYKPQTDIGKISQTGGQMLPALIAPGSLPQKALSVLGATAGTELAGRGAEALGAPQGIVDAARAVGGVGGGLAANLRIAPGAPRPMPQSAPTPNLDELRSAKNAAYKTVDDAGVQYRPEAVGRLASDVRAATAAEEIDPVLHPKALAVQARIDKLADEPLTLTRIDKIRRSINDNVLASASKDERRIGHIMRDTLDDFVANTQQGDVLSNGDPQVATQSLTQARELNTRVAKVEAIEGARLRAESRTSSTGSGGNADNATRQEIRKVLERGRNWTPDEKTALQSIVDGGKGQNLLRQVGKMSPSGNGLMQAGNLVAAAQTGGMSLPVTAAAMAAKYVADGMTKGKVDKVIGLVASGKAAQQLASMAVADPLSARLIADLGRIRLGGSALRSLNEAGSPNWRQGPQAPPQSIPAR